jgi:hypothetical protein
LRVTCTHTGDIAYSDTVEVAIKPFYECYCNDNLGAGNTCAFGEYISNVSFVGGNLNNSSTCVSVGNNNNYSAYWPTGTMTDTVTTGDYVDLSVTYAGSNSRIAAWIDYDHSGTFDNNEFILVGEFTNGGSTQVTTVEIPGSALGGLTGMRIRTNDATSPLDSGDACTTTFMGETEDYVIMIEQAPACSGTPVVGTIPASNLICHDKAIELLAAGVVHNSGMTYQWEESDDDGASDPWTDVAGEQERILHYPSGITSAKYFRLKAVCTNIMDSAYTNSMHMVLDSFYSCYDAGADLGGNGCFSSVISNVSIDNTPLDNNSGCNVSWLGTRSSFAPTIPGATATLLGQGVYTINITVNAMSSIGVWIDFDRNGTFDPTEFTLVSGRSGRGKISADITIPSGVATGLTGMRVRTNNPLPFGGVMAPNTAAWNYANGESEDYVITLDTLRPVTNAITTDIGNNEITVRWSNGNGTGRVVVAKEAATTLTDPAPFTDYRSDPVFAGAGDMTAAGNYVVYNDSRDTFVTVTNLNLNTSYEFFVYEYLSTPTGPVYVLPGQLASGTTLPVKLLSFNAISKNDDVLLSWSTASETNNKGFGIERSAEKNNWKEIGFVKGKGSISAANKYAYTDIDPFTNANTLYYRLRQEDFNGAITYSQAVKVSKNGAAKANISLYPNPFEAAIVLNVQTEQAGEMHITIKDLFGKTVAEQTTVAGKGNTILTVDQLGHLATGIYFLQVEQNGEVQNFKVTKR